MTILDNSKIRFSSAASFMRWWADNWGNVTAGELHNVSRVLSKREKQKLEIMVHALSSSLKGAK